LPENSGDRHTERPGPVNRRPEIWTPIYSVGRWCAELGNYRVAAAPSAEHLTMQAGPPSVFFSMSGSTKVRPPEILKGGS